MYLRLRHHQNRPNAPKAFILLTETALRIVVSGWVADRVTLPVLVQFPPVRRDSGWVSWIGIRPVRRRHRRLQQLLQELL